MWTLRASIRQAIQGVLQPAMRANSSFSCRFGACADAFHNPVCRSEFTPHIPAMFESLGRLAAFIALFVLFFTLACVGLTGWMFAHVPVPPDLITHEQIKQFHAAYAYRLGALSSPYVLSGSIFLASLIAFGRRSLKVAIPVAISIPVLAFCYSAKLALDHAAFPTTGNPTPFRITSSQPMTDTTTAQQRAVKAFPALGDAHSKLNHEFVQRYKEHKNQDPAYFGDPEWPTKLARESQAALYKP
jgi:hypothetical protein